MSTILLLKELVRKSSNLLYIYKVNLQISVRSFASNIAKVAPPLLRLIQTTIKKLQLILSITQKNSVHNSSYKLEHST
jgi:hypothetical protein